MLEWLWHGQQSRSTSRARSLAAAERQEGLERDVGLGADGLAALVRPRPPIRSCVTLRPERRASIPRAISSRARSIGSCRGSTPRRRRSDLLLAVKLEKEAPPC